jgi:GH35 family endo-1,4-beta-xylanase
MNTCAPFGIKYAEKTISQAFEFAHEADPDALLFYGD